MLRWLNPLIFFGAAVYAFLENRDEDGRLIVLFGMDYLPGLKADPQAQAEATWMLLLAVAVIFLIRAIYLQRVAAAADGEER